MSPDERRVWLATEGDSAIEVERLERKRALDVDRLERERALETAKRAKKQAAEQERRDRLERERALEAASPMVEVVQYKTPGDYERAAKTRLREGWVVSGQSQEPGQTHRIRGATTGALIGGLFMLPRTGAAIGGLRGKREPGVITVTWTKPPSTPVLSSPPAAPRAGPSAELERLAELHRSGALTEDEFIEAKRKVLGG